MEEVERFANFPSKYMGTIDPQGRLNLYDGRLRVTDSEGGVEVEFEPAAYLDHLAEHVEPWSYMKFPYYKSDGYPDGLYRVGPLARLYACSGLATPKAAAEAEKLGDLATGRLRGGSLLFHYARLIELLYALERAEELLNDPGICGTPVKYSGPVNNVRGVGVVEAPRGTLIHDYEVDEHGAMIKANLIVATGHNNLAMNRAVTLVAREYIKGRSGPRGAAEPGGRRHTLLRSLSLLRHPCRGADAIGGCHLRRQG